MLRSAFPGLFLKHDVLVPAPVPVPVPIPVPVPVPVPIPDSCFSRRPFFGLWAKRDSFIF